MGLFDLVLDRQPVAIPARHEVRIEAGELPGLDHHVLEDLAEAVADVQRAVGVGRAIVQHEQRRPVARGAQAFVKSAALRGVVPGLDPARLALGQIAAHRKRSVRQVQGLAVVRCGAHGRRLAVGRGRLNGRGRDAARRGPSSRPRDAGAARATPRFRPPSGGGAHNSVARGLAAGGRLPPR